MPQNNIPPIIISFERDTSELIRVIEKGAKTISDRRIKMAAEKWLQDYLHLLTPLFSKNGKEQKILSKLHTTTTNVRLVREDWLYGLRIIFKEFKNIKISYAKGFTWGYTAKYIFPQNVLRELKAKDRKVWVLAQEVNCNWHTNCWNACGILMRIILERSLDKKRPDKKNEGLKRKISICLSDGTFGKSISEALSKLDHSTKITGDIVAHDSNLILDKNDIELAIIPLNVLLKDVFITKK